MSRPTLRNPRDLGAGLLYVAFGLGAVIVSRRYAFGSGSDMGPGYFPTVLGYILLLIGSAAVIRAFLRDGPGIGPIAWRPLALVVGGTAVFALLLPVLGLVIALLTLTLVSAAASRAFAFDLRAALGLAALLAFCVGVFVVGLNLPLPLLGSWLSGG